MLHESPANEILYGGSAGPGKSHALRAEAFIWAIRCPGIQVYLFRRTNPELEKNHILPSLVEYPQEFCSYKEQKKRWEFRNGSMIHMCHVQYEKDVFTYQGAEIHLLLIDELTTFTEWIYQYLRARVRCTLEMVPNEEYAKENRIRHYIPQRFKHKVPGIICASNPGGVGHLFVKSMWIEQNGEKIEPFKIWEVPTRTKVGIVKMLRQYIPGLLEDNPTLNERDPGYIERLDSLPEPYRTAYMTGDWDIFLGQAFKFFEQTHVVDPMPIPPEAPLYMTFDWGFGRPFSLGWHWIDADGRAYRFAEYYGWNGEPNQGVRMEDPLIAEKILEVEEKQGIKGRDIVRLAGHDCFNRKPNYKGGGQGPSTAEEFASKGVYLTTSDDKTPHSRMNKFRQMHARLMLREDEPPMYLVYRSCKHFIRTIPLLQMDPNGREDVDTDMEDHVYDEVGLLLLFRPIEMKLPSPRLNEWERRLESLYQPVPTDDWEIYAHRDQRSTMDYLADGLGQIEGPEEKGDFDEYIDYGDQTGDTISTIRETT
jgi:hypothetical protein